MGPFIAGRAGKTPLQFSANSAKALFTYLAEEGGQVKVHLRETLAELLWPGMPPGAGRKNLRQALYELNKQLRNQGSPEILIATRQKIEWNGAGKVEVDTHVFRRYMQTPSIENLKQAVSLYRGEFLADFFLPDNSEFNTWVRNRREYYRRGLHKALYDLIKLEPSQTEFFARRLLESDPLEEEAVYKLMKALAETGARIEAIKQYAVFRDTLQNEFGVDPQPETTLLYEQIAQGDLVTPRDIESTSRSERFERVLRLPNMSTPFFGREEELEKIIGLLQNPSHRLLCIVGPGGTGKTRLSIQVAADLGDIFEDGIYFVPLSQVQSMDELILVIANAIEIAFYRNAPPHRQILDYLRDKQILLILDNFEHLTASSSFLSEMLSAAPRLKLLVNSRVPVMLLGEQLYILEGLPFPRKSDINQFKNLKEEAASYSSVQLFVERARRVKPDFDLNSENGPAIFEICRMTMGMPLGIELAAAWAALLHPSEIVKEISRSLDFLTANWANLPQRQRSIRAVFESSWSMLTEVEKKVFKWLCIFSGSFSRKAAQEVTDASLRTMLSLVNKAWLQRSDSGRFQQHDLMRKYGLEQLKGKNTDYEKAKQRHATFYADYVADQAVRLRGPEQLVGLEAIESEFDTNIKSAWGWLVQRKDLKTVSDKMALGLFHFVWIRARYEEFLSWSGPIRQMLTRYLIQEAPLETKILGTFDLWCEETLSLKDSNQFERVCKLWQNVRLQQQEKEMGFWYILLTSLYLAQKNDANAEISINEAVERVRELNDPWFLGASFIFQAGKRNDLHRQEKLFLEAAQIFKSLGVIFEQGFIARNLGQTALFQNRPFYEFMPFFEQASQCFKKVAHKSYLLSFNHDLAEYFFVRGMYQEAFELFRVFQRSIEKTGNLSILAQNLDNESEHALRFSTYDHALETRLRSLELGEMMEIKAYLPWWRFGLGEIFRVYGDLEQAKESYEEAEAGFDHYHIILGKGYSQRAKGDIALKSGEFQNALGYYQDYLSYSEAFNHSWSIAHAHGKIGLTFASFGWIDKARREIRKALGISQELGPYQLHTTILLGEVACLSAEQKYLQAAALAELIINHPSCWVETKQQVNQFIDSFSTELSEIEYLVAREMAQNMELEEIVLKN